RPWLQFEASAGHTVSHGTVACVSPRSFGSPQSNRGAPAYRVLASFVAITGACASGPRQGADGRPTESRSAESIESVSQACRKGTEQMQRGDYEGAEITLRKAMESPLFPNLEELDRFAAYHSRGIAAL